MKAYHLLLLIVSAQKLVFRFAFGPFIQWALLSPNYSNFYLFIRTTGTGLQLKSLEFPHHLSSTVFISSTCRTYCSNLEMEPKYPTKSDVQLKPKITSRTKNDERLLQKTSEWWMPSECNDVSCFQQISKKS